MGIFPNKGESEQKYLKPPPCKWRIMFTISTMLAAPLKTKMEPENAHFVKENIFQTSMFGFHVSFPGCSPLQNLHKTIEASNSHNFHLSSGVLPHGRTSPCHSSSARLCWYLVEHRPNHFQFCSLYLPKGWRLGSIIPEIKTSWWTNTSYIILSKGLAWWLGATRKNRRTSVQTPPYFHWSKPNLWLKRSEKLSQTTSLYIQLHRFLLLSMKASHYPNARCHLPAPRTSGWCWLKSFALALGPGEGGGWLVWSCLIHGTFRPTVHDRFYQDEMHVFFFRNCERFQSSFRFTAPSCFTLCCLMILSFLTWHASFLDSSNDAGKGGMARWPSYPALILLHFSGSSICNLHSWQISGKKKASWQCVE